MKWYLMVLRKYAEFEGRSRRQEYWMFVLFNAIFSYSLMGLDYLIGIEIGILNLLYSLALMIPSLAVGVRRLHDVDKSGWYMLLMFLPIIGWVWLIVLFATDGTTGSNQYGADPKNPTDEINEIGVAVD